MRINKFFRFINRANSLLFFALTIAICFLLAIAFYADNEKDQIKKPVPVKRVVKKKSAAIPTSVTFHSSKVDGDISIVYVRTRKQGKSSEGIVFYNHTKESFINPFADGEKELISYRLIPQLGNTARYVGKSEQAQVDDPQYVAAIVEEEREAGHMGSGQNLYVMTVDGSRMELVAADVIEIIDSFAKEDELRILFKDGDGLNLAILGADLKKQEIVGISGTP